MAIKSAIQAPTSHQWGSFTRSVKNWGYVVSEDAARFGRERLAETILRSSGMLMILCSIGVWLIPVGTLSAASLTQFALGSAFMIVGLGIYFFATRGFRREIQFHADPVELRVANLNARGDARVCLRFAPNQIQSLFVRRPDGPNAMAELHAHTKTMPRSVCMMRGQIDDITDLHRQLCHDLHAAHPSAEGSMAGAAPARPMGRWQTVAPTRVKAETTSRRPKRGPATMPPAGPVQLHDGAVRGTDRRVTPAE